MGRGTLPEVRDDSGTLSEVQDGSGTLSQVQDGLEDHPGGLGRVRDPREIHDGSGDPQGGQERVRGTLSEIRHRSGNHLKGPGRVGRFSIRSRMGREVTRKVWTGRGTTWRSGTGWGTV